MSARNKITHIIKRDGRIIPFDQKKIADGIQRAASSVGGHDFDLSQKITNDVVKILHDCFQQPDMPLVNEIQDIIERALIENGHARTAKAYILHRDQREQIRNRIRHKLEDPRIPYQIMYETLIWNMENGCDTIENLNNRIKNGELPDLVHAAEERFNLSIRQTAEAIAEEKDRVKLVVVAGPSSSGKTTTTAKLAQKLNDVGFDTVPLNLDHYFFDLEQHPKDEHGDYDFETPEALDLTLIDDHLAALVEGKCIKMPYYDFEKGKRYLDAKDIQIHPNQVIIVDTLHGLYKPMTKSITSEQKIKVYIETISQLRDMNGRFVRWTDIRLLRRMVRDNATRGYDPHKTIGHWHYVRRSEMKHIIPFNHEADFKLNGSLPYELPYLKKHAFKFFPDFIRNWIGDASRRDAFIRAERVHSMLLQIEDYDDETIIPWDSLLREFIGGSILKLH
jgi:uridine kinase